MTKTVLAALLYASYSVSVGGVSVNGQKLPSWEELVADESRAAVVAGWEASAQTAIDNLAAKAGVRAKMYCSGKAADENTQGAANIQLNAVVSGSEENKSFAVATPSAQVNMHISNLEAVPYFEQGAEYYVDFIKVEATDQAGATQS